MVDPSINHPKANETAVRKPQGLVCFRETSIGRRLDSVFGSTTTSRYSTNEEFYICHSFGCRTHKDIFQMDPFEVVFALMLQDLRCSSACRRVCMKEIFWGRQRLCSYGTNSSNSLAQSLHLKARIQLYGNRSDLNNNRNFLNGWLFQFDKAFLLIVSFVFAVAFC